MIERIFFTLVYLNSVFGAFSVAERQVVAALAGFCPYTGARIGSDVSGQCRIEGGNVHVSDILSSPFIKDAVQEPTISQCWNGPFSKLSAYIVPRFEQARFTIQPFHNGRKLDVFGTGRFEEVVNLQWVLNVVIVDH